MGDWSASWEDLHANREGSPPPCGVANSPVSGGSALKRTRANSWGARGASAGVPSSAGSSVAGSSMGSPPAKRLSGKGKKQDDKDTDALLSKLQAALKMNPLVTEGEEALFRVGEIMGKRERDGGASEAIYGKGTHDETTVQIRVGSCWDLTTKVGDGHGGTKDSHALFQVLGFSTTNLSAPKALGIYGYLKTNIGEMSTEQSAAGNIVLRTAGPHNAGQRKATKKIMVGGEVQRRQSEECNPAFNIDTEELYPHVGRGEARHVVMSTMVHEVDIASCSKKPVVLWHKSAPRPNYDMSLSSKDTTEHFQFEWCYDNCVSKGGESGGLIQKVTMTCDQLLEREGRSLRANPQIFEMLMCSTIRPTLGEWWGRRVRNKQWEIDERTGPELRLDRVPFALFAAMSLSKYCEVSYKGAAREWVVDFASTEIFAGCMDTIIMNCSVGHETWGRGYEAVVWVQMVFEEGTSTLVFKVFRRVAHILE